MKTFIRIGLIALSVLLGLVFLFSAYVKLYPVELFELTLIDIGVANWFLAPFFARLLIALEFLVGFLLIFNLYLKKFTLKFTIGVLVFFTFYLIWLIIVEGNKGNCNCFGTYLPLTPLESIIKNIVMLILTLVLYRFHTGFKWKFLAVVLPVIVLGSLTLPFVLNPVDINAAERTFKSEEVNYNLGLDILYNNPKVVEPKVDLRKGKHIVAFMSLTCPHCRIGAYKMHIIKKNNPEISVFFVLNGDKEMIAPFFEETKAGDIPYTILLGPDFVKISGVRLPAIFWVNDGIVEKRTKYINLNEDEILNWVKK